MNVFDLHCDTITVCDTESKSLQDSDCDITMQKAENLDTWAQLFAVWMPDEYRGAAAIDYFERVYHTFTAQTGALADRIARCQKRGDLDAAFAAGKAAAILTVEGGAALAGDLARVSALYDRGVRLMTLTWNAENELGFGCREDGAKGLKAFGKDAVREMERLGMVVDVSHLNRAGFYDVARITEKPFIASHSNAAAVWTRVFHKSK